MSSPNPFRNAFRASDAHVFESQIGEHMRKAARLEGHRPSLPGPKAPPDNPTAYSRIEELMERGLPMAKLDVMRELPDVNGDTVIHVLKVLGVKGKIRTVSIGPRGTKIWRAV